MASPPEGDLLGDGKSCSPCLHDCDGDQSPRAPSVQGRSRQLNDHSKMRETEELLAAGFTKLSVRERSMAMDDVHCVGEEMEETAEMIEESLTEFDRIVQTTVDYFYTIAVNQNRSYVEDSSLQLKFLRANRFNVRKSVHHMMSFLRHKAMYFGEEKLTQDIVPDDLTKEEIALMRTGFFQIFKERDPKGRVILYNSSPGRMPAEFTIETLVHVIYHILFNIVIPIPEVQTKGVVMIYYDEAKGDENVKSPGFTFQMKAHSFFEALPFRISSLHVCIYSSPGSLALHNKMAQVGLKAISEHAVTRTRLHYGSNMERQYELQDYGIPLDNFPVDKMGNIMSENQMAWCHEYLENVPLAAIDEQAGHNNNGPPQNLLADGTSIRETDVLLGRGLLVQNHAGNVRFRNFLEDRAEVYDNMPRYLRMNASIRYTQELLSSGTRFLRQNPETQLWVVCNFDQAMDKVAQFYRTRRRNKRRNNRV